MSDFDGSVAEYYISYGDGHEVCIDLIPGDNALVPASWRAILSVPMTWPDGRTRKQAVLHIGGESAADAYQGGTLAARRLLADPRIWVPA